MSVSPAAPVFMTLSRQDLAAYEFLNLQANVKDWMERVLERKLGDKDIHQLCKDGSLLCELINKMFPGCIKKYHPANSVAMRCLENISLFLKVCTKMGMKAQTFEPLDLFEAKNMLQVLVTLEALAGFVTEKGFKVPWKEKQNEFDVKELQAAEATYSPSQFADMFAKMKAEQRKEKRAAKAAEAAAPAAVASQAPAAAAAPAAASESKDDKMKRLLKEMDRALEGKSDTTKMHLAVEMKIQPALDYMLNQKLWDIKKPDGDGNLPLHVACIFDNEDAVHSLIKGGTKIDPQNHEGNTPLHLAIANGNPNITAALIRAGAKLDVENRHGDTPLHVAASKNDEKQFAMLVKAGADLNARNRDGNTPLHVAAWNGNVANVRAMKAGGADAGIANKDGNTAAHFAALRGKKQVIEDILGMHNADIDAKNKDNATALQLATEADEQDVVSLLAGAGANINEENIRGWTPLYTAAYNGNEENVNFLCKRGADPNQQNSEGWAPLHAACANGHYRVVKDLVRQWKAKPNIQTHEGTTPLFFAAHTGRPKICEILMDAGANVSLCKKGGWQPLHGAVYNDHDEVAEMLIKAKCRLDDGVDEIKGYAPIHIAIASEEANENVVRMLIKSGCDINKQTNNGATAMHLSVFWANRRVCEYLLAKGARSDLKNNKGRRPLDLAAHYGHKELAEWLAKKLGTKCPPISGKAKPKVADMSTPSAPPAPMD